MVGPHTWSCVHAVTSDEWHKTM